MHDAMPSACENCKLQTELESPREVGLVKALLSVIDNQTDLSDQPLALWAGRCVDSLRVATWDKYLPAWYLKHSIHSESSKGHASQNGTKQLLLRCTTWSRNGPFNIN